MVLTDEQLTQRVRSALERETAGIDPPPRLLARIHEELGSAAARGGRRRGLPSLRWRPADLAALAALLVVIAVAALFLGLHGRKAVAPAGGGGFGLVFRVEPTPQVPVVTRGAVARAVLLMRWRIATVLPSGGSRVAVSSAGDTISVRVASGSRISRTQLLLVVATTGHLAFYDWEANVLTPNGKAAATQLSQHNPPAVEISQGGGTAAPGSAGAGSMSLYEAARLASRQPKQQSTAASSRIGPEYFAFAAGNSAACTTAARAYGMSTVSGQHCYLAGPADSVSVLDQSLPPGVNASQAQKLAVKQGWVVVQAASPSGFGQHVAWSSPTAQFYVLRDRVALFGNDITNPRQSTDSSGAPNVSFGFTRQGAKEFQNVTSQIAHRGALVSGLGQTLNQHFAVVLDMQLISVPFIDFKQLPDGIAADHGAEIAAGSTTSSARALATELRLGALPVNLKLIS
jgi:hypothetical protein